MKVWKDEESARRAADVITDAWLKLSKRDLAAMARDAALTASDADCPECEVCCAIGLCCPLGSESQRASLARLLMKG